LNQRIVFHVDFDYFYAQCEELRNPKLKTKPVAVCIFSDRGGDSGAIATANYKAREFGVKSGIPIIIAKKKLQDFPEAVFLPADFEYYSEISQKAMSIIESYADIFEYVGRDEAYLDVTKKTDCNFTNASHLSQQLKNSIRDKVKLTCSIGVSPNKLISKIASAHKKPDGLTIVPPEQVSKFLVPLMIREIPGIGKKTEEKFIQMGLETISRVKKLEVFSLNQKFGRKTGTYIYNAVRGIDNGTVTQRPPTIQYSKIVTLKKDSKDYSFLAKSLEELCGEIYKIIQKKNKLFKSVGIQFVQVDMINKTKSRMLKNSTMNRNELQKVTMQLLEEILQDQKIPIRRIGLKVSELSELGGQSSLTNYF